MKSCRVRIVNLTTKGETVGTPRSREEATATIKAFNFKWTVRKRTWKTDLDGEVDHFEQKLRWKGDVDGDAACGLK